MYCSLFLQILFLFLVGFLAFLLIFRFIGKMLSCCWTQEQLQKWFWLYGLRTGGSQLISDKVMASRPVQQGVKSSINICIGSKDI